MRKFNPEMKVVRFGNEDVIATSGAPDRFTLTNFGDKTNANGVINFNNKTYTNDDSGASEFLSDISGYYSKVRIARDTNNDYSIITILDRERTNDTFKSPWDGTFIYDGSLFFKH